MRRTCADCDSLELHINSIQGLAWAGCVRTGSAVPQHTQPREAPKEDGSAKHSRAFNAWRSVFWRIPVGCPLPDTMVEKTQRQQPMHLWQTKDWQVPGERIQ